LTIFHYFQQTYRSILLLLKTTMDEIWIDDMLTAGKYPETEDEMMQYYLTGFSTNKLSYELISEFEIRIKFLSAQLLIIL